MKESCWHFQATITFSRIHLNDLSKICRSICVYARDSLSLDREKTTWQLTLNLLRKFGDDMKPCGLVVFFLRGWLPWKKMRVKLEFDKKCAKYSEVNKRLPSRLKIKFYWRNSLVNYACCKKSSFSLNSLNQSRICSN